MRSAAVGCITFTPIYLLILELPSYVSESELLVNGKTAGLYKFIQAKHSVSFITPKLVVEEGTFFVVHAMNILRFYVVQGELHRTYFLPTMERLGQEYDALNGDKLAISVWKEEKYAELNRYDWVRVSNSLSF